LHAQTDASLPYLDSSLTAISLIASWMIAKKYLENWILWIAANLVYIGMYYVKDLHGTSILYALLLVMAIKGILIGGRGWINKISLNHTLIGF
jgi:nicotinamide mononucleotide transporter